MSKSIGIAGSLLLLVTSVGCAHSQKAETANTEKLLVAAGFVQRPADTPEKIEHLQTLPQRQIISHRRDGQLYYTYADSKDCQCLLAGDQHAFDEFQTLAARQQLAEEERRAAEEAENARMDWGFWGPWPWW